MTLLNVEALAIDQGIDPVTARDKDIQVSTFIRNSGLAPASVSNEVLVVADGSVVSFSATLHFTNGSTAPLVYTETEFNEQYEIQKATVGGTNPFTLSKFDFKDSRAEPLVERLYTFVPQIEESLGEFSGIGLLWTAGVVSTAGATMDSRIKAMGDGGILNVEVDEGEYAWGMFIGCPDYITPIPSEGGAISAVVEIYRDGVLFDSLNLAYSENGGNASGMLVTEGRPASGSLVAGATYTFTINQAAL